MIPRARRWPGPSAVRGTAVILPGTGYSAEMPLLYWAARTLVTVGFEVIAIEWPGDRAREDDGRALVAEGLAAAAALTGRGPDLVVAKSLGCLSAEILPDVPHVLLTPVLAPGYPASLGQTRGVAAADARGCIAIGGSRDPLWSAEAASARGYDVVEIADTTHSLEVDGSWRGSLDALALVLDAVERLGTRVAAGRRD